MTMKTLSLAVVAGLVAISTASSSAFAWQWGTRIGCPCWSLFEIKDAIPYDPDRVVAACQFQGDREAGPPEQLRNLGQITFDADNPTLKLRADLSIQFDGNAGLSQNQCRYEFEQLGQPPIQREETDLSDWQARACSKSIKLACAEILSQTE
jgi:hypothetical protein